MSCCIVPHRIVSCRAVSCCRVVSCCFITCFEFELHSNISKHKQLFGWHDYFLANRINSNFGPMPAPRSLNNLISRFKNYRAAGIKIFEIINYRNFTSRLKKNLHKFKFIEFKFLPTFLKTPKTASYELRTRPMPVSAPPAQQFRACTFRNLNS